MKEFKILDEIENTGSTKEKFALLKKGMTPYMEEYLRMTFGDAILNIASRTIEKALEIKTPIKHKDIGARVHWWLHNHNKQSSLLAFSGMEDQKRESSFNDFRDLFGRLQNIRGQDAMDEIKLFLKNCEPRDAKWYSRALIKYLACGMSYGTVNKVFKELKMDLIVFFEVALYEKIDGYPLNKPDREGLKEQLIPIFQKHKEIWLEPKYDGMRIIERNCNLLRKRKTEAISRNGLTVNSVQFLHSEFDRVMDGKFIEFDGEIIAKGKDFNTLMTQMHRKHDLSVTMPREYQVFDATSIGGNDITYLPYIERRRMLEEVFTKIDSEIIKLVKNKKATTPEEVIEMYEKSVAAGYEGIMIKLDVPYDRGEGRENGYKLKPVKTADLEICSLIKEGTGRYAGMTSSFEVKDATGKVRGKVGSGLKKKDIEYINKVKDGATWLGKIIEIKYDSITPEKKDGTRSIRFGRFVKFRFDKDKPEAL